MPATTALVTLGSPGTASASDGTIAIAADGNEITWETTGSVGQSWGLFTRYRHTDPEVSGGWAWVHAPPGAGGAEFWPSDGAGEYAVEVCEWDFQLRALTVCSASVTVTWVDDVFGNFVAIPAADPMLETGTIVLEADGAQLNWQMTGTLGHSSGFLIVDEQQEHWRPPGASDAFWMPAGGHTPGIYPIRVCAYDHYRDRVGECSNEVEVEISLNATGAVAPVPQPDPADEYGTIRASLDDCELSWETTGTVGQTSGFMVLTDANGALGYGTAESRYVAPGLETLYIGDAGPDGPRHVSVCAFDFHRNATGVCSEPLPFTRASSPGPTCATDQVSADAPPVDAPEPELEPPYAYYDDVMTAGMAAWRTPDGHGNACASCHTPDGIDLAYPAVSRSDIIRRASAHVGPLEGVAIADMIEAVRAQYGWVPTEDPREYRPFQPAGEVLPGDTSLERDAAFADQLIEMDLLIATADIDDLLTAQLARDELLALDLWSLRVGIPFDRFSEDRFFGEEHGVLNEWVPSVGHVPAEDDPDGWWALQDRYLAHPSQSTLLDLLDGFVGADRPVRLNHADLRGDIERFESQRMRSLLVLGHEQRREMAGRPARGVADVQPYPTGPMWQVGRLADETWTCNPVHGGAIEECMQFPLVGLSPERSWFDQMETMSLTWRYVGWLFNQNLEGVPGEPDFLQGHYFTHALKSAMYPSHHAFMRASRAARKFWGPDQSWRARRAYVDGIPSTSAFADLVFMDNFMAQGSGGHDLAYGPPPGEHRDHYVRFTANMYKMLLLLLEEEILQTGQVFEKDRLVQMLRAQADHRWYGPVDYMPVLEAHEPARALELRAWLAEIADAAEAAQEVALHPDNG